MPKFETVSLDLTYDCNFRCLHCFNCSGEHDKKRNLLSNNELYEIVKQIAKLKPRDMCFCGGETMLREKILLKCCNYLVKQSANKIMVTAVSNGYLITDEIAKELKVNGLNSIQISLDGSTAETYEWLRNKKGSFEKAIEAIKTLRTNGLKVAIAFTPTKKNKEQLLDTIQLAENLGVSMFRVQPLMNLGRAKKYLQNYMLNYDDYREIRFNLMKAQKDAIVHNRNFVIEWGDPLMHIINGKSGTGTLNYLTINGYGDLLISPYIPISFGNIRRGSLNDYINAGLYTVWNNELVKLLSESMISSNNMDLSEYGFPQIYKEENIDLDLLSEKSKDICAYYIKKFKDAKKVHAAC